MFNTDRFEFGEKSKSYILYLLMSVGMFLTTFLYGIPAGHDSFYHVIWTQAFSDNVFSGTLYPRFIPQLNSGLGGLDFFFYPPLPYWSFSIFHSFTDNQSASFALNAIFITSLSGLFCYLLCKQFTDNRSALIGGTIYMIAPYHILINWLERSAYSEFYATAFFPLIVLYLLNLLNGRKDGPKFALTLMLLSLSSLPTTLIMGFLAALIMIAHAIFNRAPAKHILKTYCAVGIWSLIGIGASCFYWLPALFLTSDVSMQFMTDGHFQFSSWFFYDNQPEPDSRHFIKLLKSFPIISLPMVLTAFFCIRKKNIQQACLPVLLFAGPLFMMTPISLPLWEVAGPLQKIQFPWRFMSGIDLALSLAVAFTWSCLNEKIRTKALIPVLCTVLAMTCVFTTYKQRHKRIRMDHIRIQSMLGAIEYLPGNMVEKRGLASTPKNSIAQLFEELSEEKRRRAQPIESSAFSSSPRRFQIAISSDGDTPTSIPLFYWKHWQAFHSATGNEIEIVSDENGVASLNLPTGEHRITLSLELFQSEWVSGLVSLVCVLILIGSYVYSRTDPHRCRNENLYA